MCSPEGSACSPRSTISASAPAPTWPPTGGPLHGGVCRALEGGGGRGIALTGGRAWVRVIQDCVSAELGRERGGGETGGRAAFSRIEEGALDHAARPAVIALPAPAPYGSS